MFYIDKVVNDKISVRDTKDGISEEMSRDILEEFIKEHVRIFGYNTETGTIGSVVYLPMNNLGNYINVSVALESYKHDNKGLSEGDFVVRYMNSLDFRDSCYVVPIQNSRTSNKGTKEHTLIKRAMIEVQGHILECKNFEELKDMVIKRGKFLSGKYRYFDDWSVMEYSLEEPNTIYWQVRMD